MTRSLSREGRDRRRDSPHPRAVVGFTEPPNSQPIGTSRSSICVTPFSKPIHSDNGDDTDDEDHTITNHSQATNHLITRFPMKPRKSWSFLSNPRLMVVNALTYNYNKPADQLLTILLDSGSQHSYIRKSTACDLGLKLKNPNDITTLTFGGYKHTETSLHVSITLRDRMYEPIALNLRTREFITTVPANFTPFSNGSTLPVVDANEKSDVDVLIGIDYYWDVVDLNRNQQLPSGFVLSYTKFGPVLSGLRTSTSSYVNTATSFKPSVVENEEHKETDEIVRRLFGLESAGLTEDPSESDESVIQQYYNTVKIIDGLIHVKFPWK
ncbi:hypothetical protein Aduo_008612 [Ancylostoma duodenale]